MVIFYIKTNILPILSDCEGDCEVRVFWIFLLSFGLISLISELGQTPTNIGRTGGRTGDQKLSSGDDWDFIGPIFLLNNKMDSPV